MPDGSGGAVVRWVSWWLDVAKLVGMGSHVNFSDESWGTDLIHNKRVIFLNYAVLCFINLPLVLQ